MDDAERSILRQGELGSRRKQSQRPGRLASIVVEELAHEIIGGTWSEGDVLPNEPALCTEFGFSRTVIREALKLLEETDPRKPYFDKILAEEEVTLDQFKLKGFHNLFFSKGERAAWCFPHDLEERDAKDEENRNKKKLTLRFDLPRGSYATLVVKRITRVEVGEQ